MSKTNLFKCHSTDIQGPFCIELNMGKEKDKQQAEYYEVQLQLVDNNGCDDEISQSTTTTRRFFSTTHSLITKKCEDAMEHDTTLKLLVKQVDIKLPFGIIHTPSMSNVFTTLAIADENPATIVGLEWEVDDEMFIKLV